jgi:autotransporter-associated beta strand protein
LVICSLALANDYVVTVPAGETNAVDAAFVAALGTSTRLVKRGSGVLHLSAALSNYAGEIVAEEGVLFVTESGSLGTSAGYTTVSNGASIVFNAASANGIKVYSETFQLAGEGAPGEMGALANIGASLTGQCFRYLTLLENAKIEA